MRLTVCGRESCSQASVESHAVIWKVTFKLTLTSLSKRADSGAERSNSFYSSLAIFFGGHCPRFAIFLTWKPPFRLTFFSFTSDPESSRSLSSSALTFALVFFFGVFFFTGPVFFGPPPLVARIRLFSCACNLAAKAASLSLSNVFFFFGTGESLTSDMSSDSSFGRFLDTGDDGSGLGAAEYTASLLFVVMWPLVCVALFAVNLSNRAIISDLIAS